VTGTGSRRLPLLLRQAMYNLRGGFLVRPLTIALAVGFTGGFLSWLDEEFPLLNDWVPKAIFPSHADPQVAQIILSGIATSIMTVVSIVFAILLMTLTLASMQFSPRIIVSFSQDRVTQWTLGIFLGTFLYCMAALPAARSLPYPFAPIDTVMGAILLAIACVAWLLFFIHHISRAISVNHIVDKIASDTEAVIDDILPWPRRDGRYGNAAASGSIDLDAQVPSEGSGYIRYIDTARLVALAKEHHIKIRVLRRVGQFVPAGVSLLAVSRGDRLSPDVTRDLLGAFDLGPSRTLQQDVEFGVLQIVDVALKAISPAVNDPTTAISCVDQLSRILIRYASREPQDSILYDPPGVVRVSIPWIGFAGLLESAMEQIRMYAKGDVAVSLRLLRALGDIVAATPDSQIRSMLVDTGKRVVAGCAERLNEEELRSLRARLMVLETWASH
jgi:uncharacterized membrane protein